MSAKFGIQPGARCARGRLRRGAARHLDEWDEPNFARTRATLHRHFPEAEAYMFEDLAASPKGAASKGAEKGAEAAGDAGALERAIR